MHKIKSEKGITLVVLVITIIALSAISIPVAVNMSGVIELKKYTKFKQDIDRLREAISSVYDEDIEISLIGNKYTGGTTFLYGIQNGQNVKNPNDGADYYAINLTKLNTHLGAQIQLNYGKDNISGNQTGTDLYIINGKTKTIYYVKGVEYKKEKYHRLPEEYTTLKDVYTITYDANGGTGGPNMQTVNTSGTLVTVGAAPTRSGYKFLGYKIDRDSKLYKQGDSVTVTKNIILTAQWEKEQ